MGCKGCKIEWAKGKNVTRKSVKQKGKGSAKTVIKLVKADSFFNFFNPPEVDENDKDVSEEDRATLVLDYDVGFSIKEKLIPRAVLYFTGEVFGDDSDYEDEDTDEED